MKMEVFQRPWLSNGPAKQKPLFPQLSSPGVTTMTSLTDLPSHTSERTESHGPHEYEYRDRLRTWLVKMIESAAVPGLKWLNDEKNIFRMPWKHAGRQDYNLEDSKIFMEWAKHSGRYREGIDKPEPIVWKTRLRCALNKMPDIRELPEMSRLDISDPYRVYELLPPMHKGKGNDEKIRRRVYKRSNGSADEIDGSISPKIMRSCDIHPALLPSPVKPFFPSHSHPGGSTGSQTGSQDQDSHDDLSDPDHSPVSSEHAAWMTRHAMNYPIPVSVGQPPPHSMAPSSIALSLINCNPTVANDPILTSSLTSLATQVLQMEHLLQVYMNQTRAQETELAKVNEQLKESTKSLSAVKDECRSLQQCLVSKLIHDTPKSIQKHVNQVEEHLKVMKSVSNLRNDQNLPVQNSNLLNHLPTEHRIGVLKEQLNHNITEATSIRAENQRLQLENQQMHLRMEQVNVNMMKLNHSLDKNHLSSLAISMESPPSSRNSDSGPEDGDSANQEEEIEIIEC